MKVLFTALVLGSAFLSIQAQAAVGEERGLPSGEDSPLFVKQIYSSPQGEVQFLEADDLSRTQSALLRLPSGKLANLKEVHGHTGCRAWMDSLKEQSLPTGCEFLFQDQNVGSFFPVQSEDMAEASLFHAVSRVTREAHVSL